MPPTKRARLPRASISPAAFAAQSRYAETLAGSHGSMTSIKWCGNTTAFRGGRLGRRNIHSAVQRHRVERNDLGVQPARQGDANSRFPEAVGPVR